MLIKGAAHTRRPIYTLQSKIFEKSSAILNIMQYKSIPAILINDFFDNLMEIERELICQSHNLTSDKWQSVNNQLEMTNYVNSNDLTLTLGDYVSYILSKRKWQDSY